jgi:polyferredoxin
MFFVWDENIETVEACLAIFYSVAFFFTGYLLLRGTDKVSGFKKQELLLLKTIRLLNHNLLSPLLFISFLSFFLYRSHLH